MRSKNANQGPKSITRIMFSFFTKNVKTQNKNHSKLKRNL